MTIDDFRRGVVRICDGEGSSRGTGFFVSRSGHVLTCNHVVDSTPEISVTLVDGRRIPARHAPDLSLPELDFAVLLTDTTPEFVIPVDLAGAVGNKVWASGFQMQGQVTDALPTVGTIAGQNSLEYSFNDRVYRLPEVMRLERALVEPGISGGCAALFPDAVAIGVVNASLKDKGGFILPFCAISDQTCALYKLLQENRRTVARYGRFINWVAIRDLCRRSSSQALDGLKSKGQYSSELFVRREAVEAVLERFLSGGARILSLVGQTGTGKTNCAAFITESLGQQHTTLLLPAYRLTPQPGGLASSIAGILSKVSNPGLGPSLGHEAAALSPADVTRAIAESVDGDLIILLDGLNELPGASYAARVWIEDTCEWLRSNENVRLIVTCRPEYWDSVKRMVGEDLLYSEPLPGPEENLEDEGNDQSSPQSGEKLFRLEDFTKEEAAQASEHYGFPMKAGVKIFRHPLLYNIARGALKNGLTAIPTMDQLFFSYVDTAVKQISSKQDRPSGFILRSTLETMANTLRSNKSLWIERRQFIDAFHGDPSMAGALLDEHLLVEGESGVRFAFDEIAYFLVSQVVGKEFDKKVAGEIDWSEFQKEDPIGADSLAFYLASLESRGESESVAQILTSLGEQCHAGLEGQSNALHALFVRHLRWLRTSSSYFSVILAFVESCTKKTYRLGSHSLGELADLPELSPVEPDAAAGADGSARK